MLHWCVARKVSRVGTDGTRDSSGRARRSSPRGTEPRPTPSGAQPRCDGLPSHPLPRRSTADRVHTRSHLAQMPTHRQCRACGQAWHQPPPAAAAAAAAYFAAAALAAAALPTTDNRVLRAPWAHRPADWARRPHRNLSGAPRPSPAGAPPSRGGAAPAARAGPAPAGAGPAGSAPPPCRPASCATSAAPHGRSAGRAAPAAAAAAVAQLGYGYFVATTSSTSPSSRPQFPRAREVSCAPNSPLWHRSVKRAWPRNVHAMYRRVREVGPHSPSGGARLHEQRCPQVAHNPAPHKSWYEHDAWKKSHEWEFAAVLPHCA
jgi:hypothetical protein